MGHGKLLAGIEEPARAIALATDCISRNWSVRELEEFLSTTRPALRGRRTERTAITRREMELPNGVFLTIKADTGDTSGTIEIPFYSATEKEWVLEALAGGRAGLRRPSGRRRGAGGTARASRPTV
jgi:hypothetical protein